MLFSDKHKFIFKHGPFWHLGHKCFGHSKYTLIKFIKLRNKQGQESQQDKNLHVQLPEVDFSGKSFNNNKRTEAGIAPVLTKSSSAFCYWDINAIKDEAWNLGVCVHKGCACLHTHHKPWLLPSPQPLH